MARDGGRDVSPVPSSLAINADDAVRQSLARGTVGGALLDLERAARGTGTWETAHASIRRATTGPADASDHAGLFYGVPALTFLLRAAAHRQQRYRPALERLDEHLLRLARRKLDVANARAHRGEMASFAEFDIFYGLVGVGVLLFERAPRSDVLVGIARHVVTLTRPHHRDGLELPGWWVDHDPDPTRPTPGGHANLGMAHGAAGLLAFLALAQSGGREVDGHSEAIAALTRWFDRWRQEGVDGPWWPEWLTYEEIITGRPAHPGPGRPSWCYGAVGIARARQLAALATHDEQRAAAAEDELLASLTDTQLDRISEPGLCHGMAGIYQTAWRASRDGRSVELTARLPAVAARFEQLAREVGSEPGFLTGGAGVGLAAETVRHNEPPLTGWDTCLLIA
jgi:lantibiotic biosynthesis protein